MNRGRSKKASVRSFYCVLNIVQVCAFCSETQFYQKAKSNF